jgi:hypothetical protein
MIPKNLKGEDKLKRRESCDIRGKIKQKSDFLSSAVTCDDDWVFFYGPGTTWQSLQYKSTHRAVAQAVSRRVPTAAARIRVRAGMWGLWWTKWHWGRFFPRTSVSFANHHSTNFSIIIITRGWNNTPIGGRSAEWTQLDSTPHYSN